MVWMVKMWSWRFEGVVDWWMDALWWQRSPLLNIALCISMFELKTSGRWVTTIKIWVVSVENGWSKFEDGLYLLRMGDTMFLSCKILVGKGVFLSAIWLWHVSPIFIIFHWHTMSTPLNSFPLLLPVISLSFPVLKILKMSTSDVVSCW